MRKFIVYLLVLATIAVACNDSSRYRIHGRITNAEKRYIYLDELKITSTATIDSVLLGKDGKFEFKGNIQYPTYF